MDASGCIIDLDLFVRRRAQNLDPGQRPLVGKSVKSKIRYYVEGRASSLRYVEGFRLPTLHNFRFARCRIRLWAGRLPFSGPRCFDF